MQIRAQEYRLLWEQGHVLEALASIEALIGDDPDDDRTTIRRDYARLLFETGRLDRAIEVAEPLAQSFRALTDRVRLAEYYRYRGRSADFDRILEQSLRVSRLMMQYGADAENWIAAGRLMELDGVDPSRVLSHYRRLLESQPDNVGGLIAAASIAHSTRSYDVAARYYHRALEIDDTYQITTGAILAFERIAHVIALRREKQILGQLQRPDFGGATTYGGEGDEFTEQRLAGRGRKGHAALDDAVCGGNIVDRE